MNNKELGTVGEDEACKYIEKLEYNIITRNFMCNQGEIDIIAKDRDEYVFLEVKARISTQYGKPVEAVNENKQKHIKNASRYYIYKNGLENKFIRFDVIEVYIKNNRFLMNHLKNVFW